MKNYSSSLIVVLLFATLSAQAQKQTTFYLMPHIGIEWPFSKFEDKALKPAIVNNVTSNTTDKYGIALLIDFNKKSSIEIGYGHGNIGRGKGEPSEAVLHKEELEFKDIELKTRSYK